MSQFIELQRSRLEEVDVIRQAVFKRFRRNPELIPKTVRQENDILTSKNEKPHKETLIQKHEIKTFQNKYITNIDSIRTSKRLKRDIINESVNKVTDKERNFVYFDSMLGELQNRHKDGSFGESLPSLYSMYSSSPVNEVQTTKKGKLNVKRKYILSEEAHTKVNLNTLFTNEEQYGKYLDLKNLHTIYQVNQSDSTTYIDYLKLFDQIPIKGWSGAAYEGYISTVSAYLESFIEKIDPLSHMQYSRNQLVKQFSELKNTGENNNENELFCKACDKLFSKESVYKGHLAGKKHKKNSEKQQNEIEKATTEQNPLESIQFKEFKFKYLTNLLNPIIQNTISNAERQNAMTEREKMIDMDEFSGDESDYTTANSDASDVSNDEALGDDDDDNELFKELPLGADGTPIPFWLYKLQGLHQTYSCEICGNANFKGRLTFEKHFASPKHQQGLKFLGIDNDSTNFFTNITKINEAMDLWSVIKKEKRLKEGETENAIEVEDNEGNVMSEKDYLQLKKQGMV